MSTIGVREALWLAGKFLNVLYKGVECDTESEADAAMRDILKVVFKVMRPFEITIPEDTQYFVILNKLIDYTLTDDAKESAQERTLPKPEQKSKLKRKSPKRRARLDIPTSDQTFDTGMNASSAEVGAQSSEDTLNDRTAAAIEDTETPMDHANEIRDHFDGIETGMKATGTEAAAQSSEDTLNDRTAAIEDTETPMDHANEIRDHFDGIETGMKATGTEAAAQSSEDTLNDRTAAIEDTETPMDHANEIRDHFDGIETGMKATGTEAAAQSSEDTLNDRTAAIEDTETPMDHANEIRDHFDGIETGMKATGTEAAAQSSEDTLNDRTAAIEDTETPMDHANEIRDHFDGIETGMKATGTEAAAQSSEDTLNDRTAAAIEDTGTPMDHVNEIRDHFDGIETGMKATGTEAAAQSSEDTLNDRTAAIEDTGTPMDHVNEILDHFDGFETGMKATGTEAAAQSSEDTLNDHTAAAIKEPPELSSHAVTKTAQSESLDNTQLQDSSDHNLTGETKPFDPLLYAFKSARKGKKFPCFVTLDSATNTFLACAFEYTEETTTQSICFHLEHEHSIDVRDKDEMNLSIQFLLARKIYTCHKCCSANYKSEKRILNHLTKCLPSYKCDFCQQAFLHLRSKKRHEKERHLNRVSEITTDMVGTESYQFGTPSGPAFARTALLYENIYKRLDIRFPDNTNIKCPYKMCGYILPSVNSAILEGHASYHVGHSGQSQNIARCELCKTEYTFISRGRNSQFLLCCSRFVTDRRNSLTNWKGFMTDWFGTEQFEV